MKTRGQLERMTKSNLIIYLVGMNQTQVEKLQDCSKESLINSILLEQDVIEHKIKQKELEDFFKGL